jgi:hypothetical protein
MMGSGKGAFEFDDAVKHTFALPAKDSGKSD